MNRVLVVDDEAGMRAALEAPRFAWRFWDAAPIAHGATTGVEGQNVAIDRGRWP